MKDPRAGRAPSVAPHEVPLPLLAAMRLLFPDDVPQVRRIASDEARVFVVISGGRRRWIVKTSASGMAEPLQECTLGCSLRAMGIVELPSCRVIGEESTRSAAAVVMPYYQGRGLSAAYTADPNRGRMAATGMGDFLRRLGRISPEQVDGMMAPEARADFIRDLYITRYESAVTGGLHGKLRTAARHILSRLHSTPTAFGWCEDCDVIVRPDGSIRIVDFRRFGPVWPLYDLAMALEWLVRCGDAAETLVTSLISGYTGGADLTWEERHELFSWVLHRPLGQLCIMLALQKENHVAERARAIDVAVVAAQRLIADPTRLLPWVA